MLKTKQIVYLRSMAQKIKPVMQIGKDGLNDNSLETILSYLYKHELMKISILQNSFVDEEEIKEFISGYDIEFIEKKGRTIVLYKPNPKLKDPIKLPIVK